MVRFPPGPLFLLLTSSKKDYWFGASLPMSRRELSTERIPLRLLRIATVINGVTEIPEDWRKVTSKLVFEKEYVDALFGLDRLERIWVIFGFHRQRGWIARVRPRRAKGKALVEVNFSLLWA